MPVCDTCKALLVDAEVARHKCPPHFECIDLGELEQFEEFAEDGDQPPEWTAIYARHPVAAAEKFAQMRLEYEGELRVRVRNEHGVSIDLCVTAEYQLIFDASVEGPISDPARWERQKLASSWEFYKLTPIAAA